MKINHIACALINRLFAVHIRRLNYYATLAVNDCIEPETGKTSFRERKKTMRILKYMPLVVAIQALACSDDGIDDGSHLAKPPLGGSELNGRLFILERLDGHTLVGESSVQVAFTLDGRIGFSAGCVGDGGEYSLEGDVLVVGRREGGIPDIACHEDIVVQEQWLSEFFRGRPKLTIEGSRLIVARENVVMTLLDRLVADPDRPLVGPKWNINTLGHGGYSSTVSYETVPWVTFSADGTLMLFGGCNQGSGHYEATATRLTFDSVLFDDAVCPPGEGLSVMEQETFLRQVFTGTADYRIEARSLSIVHTDGVGVYASTTAAPAP